MISIVGGAIAGALGLTIGVLLLRIFRNSFAKDIDLDLYYDVLHQFKRDFAGRIGDEEQNPWTTRIILILHGIAIASIIAVTLWFVMSLHLESGPAVTTVILIWLLVTAAPPGLIVLREAKRLAVLEIASIIQLIARNQDDQEETWVIRCSRKVAGSDLFGEEEEDFLDFRISRTDLAPIKLRANGHVVVAAAGLDRTVRKSVLRQLRLRGWFVNETRDAEAEVERIWSLHDSTYAEIADELAWVVESLGFPVRDMRLSKAQLDSEAA